MKCVDAWAVAETVESLPVRGAWIEMLAVQKMLLKLAKSLPVRGAWIEIAIAKSNSGTPAVSLPVRGAWIEISPFAKIGKEVSSRSPCGERGLKYPMRIGENHPGNVAPRAGSVD